MKKFYFSILVIFSYSALIAQVWEDKLIESNSAPTIEERFSAFEEYRQTFPYTKGNGYKPYARQIDFALERVSNKSYFQPNKLYMEWLKEREKYDVSLKNSSANWVAKGPFDTPIILSNNKRRGNGRVNCIAFDPVDPNIIWIGAPSGGLWKSEDGGSNWQTNTDDLPVIGVSHIAIDPNNSQKMYIVTGDADATDTYSIGILKSIDGGISWDTTGLSYTVAQEQTVNKILINPNFSDSLYAITNSNILISSDGGNSWTTKGGVGRWRDIEFKPNNSNIMYAVKQNSGNSNVYRSFDGGDNWSVIDNGVVSGRHRPLIAVTPDNPEVIYALYSASDYSFHGLYKSSDGGDSWNLQSNSPNIMAWDTDGSGNGGQSWYNLSLGVSRNDENLVYVGGVNIWRSNNSGITWDIDASSGNGSNYSYMHVDQHAFEFSPHTNIAYAGNDGGLYKYMDNLNTWVDISDGLAISQFYNLGVSQSNPNRIVAGAQDNGTEMLTNNTWDAIMGGDGMECAFDPYNSNIIYAEFQYGGLRKSYNSGNNWSNIKPVNYEGAWNTPYEVHRNNNNIIVIGYDEVYRSNTGGAVWDSISYNVTGGQAIRSIALAPSDENYIYAASYSKIKVTKDAGQSWTYIKPGLANYNITDIAVSDTDPDKAYVTFSDYNNIHKVYATDNAGSSWTNISGNNLPGIPVNCIVYEPGSNDALYIGTDIGVYYKNNSMSEWIPFNDGLPNVIVKELEIQINNGTISAATYGRGIWQSTLSTLSTSNHDIESLNFTIFPNPAKNEININSLENSLTTIIYSITGEKIITSKSKKISTSNLTSGCYIVEVKGLYSTKRKKLIIK